MRNAVTHFSEAFQTQCICILIAGVVFMPLMAHADSAYISQETQTASNNSPAFRNLPEAVGQTGPHFGPGRTFTHAPEFSPPKLSPNFAGSVSNFAGSVTVGNYNAIAQIQAGQHDTSLTTVVGGNRDQVGVLQAGNNLVSNVVLLGMQGTSVGVIQPANSLPINMLIARLPNGSILIKR